MQPDRCRSAVPILLPRGVTGDGCSRSSPRGRPTGKEAVHSFGQGMVTGDGHPADNPALLLACAGDLKEVDYMGRGDLIDEQCERLVNRLKQFRRIATRYEIRAVTCLAMLTIAAIMLWL